MAQRMRKAVAQKDADSSRSSSKGGITTVRGRNVATRGSYTGRWAKVGNSDGFRVDKTLFKEHPEFSGAGVTLKFIAPGKLLLETADPVELEEDKDDEVMAAFLSYLDNEMVKNPKDIIPVDQNLLDEIGDLVEGVTDF